ncbi:Lectin C-type domain [Fasciola gigantica]|uniref:Lectin C-type domain n=1 Tax=Fasciola gigantica TaxID=46835 RepID=A0A504Z3S5_FASGI|nr:Lectin C-type domain [Fasciola gigantica]
MKPFDITLVVIFILFSFAYVVHGVQLSHKQISPFLTLTLVHGSSEALKTHAEAREYCQNLSLSSTEPKANGNNLSSDDASTGTATKTTKVPTTTTTTPKNIRVRSDLVSIHTPSMVHGIMSWILPLEKRQFWIGGRLKKIVQPFEGRDVHVIQRWTDGTSATYRFLDLTPLALDRIPEDQILCVSVDYASGKWGAHDCEEKMYFVCETIRLPELDSPKTQPKDVRNPTTVSPKPKLVMTNSAKQENSAPKS